MPKPRKLRWIKFYIQETLQGSTTYELTAAQESVWWRLCLLAGQWDDGGVIKTDRRRIPAVIGRSTKLVEATIQHCVESGKLEILDGGKLKVANFVKYNPVKWEREYYEETIEESEKISSETNGNEKSYADGKRNTKKQEMNERAICTADKLALIKGENSQNKAEQSREKQNSMPALKTKTKTKTKKEDLDGEHRPNLQEDGSENSGRNFVEGRYSDRLT